MSKSVIIVAGGHGSRMETKTPKQFLLLAGRPVLMHTIHKFYDCFSEIKIVLVLPFDHIETWNRLISEYRFVIPHQVVAGGKERFFSVLNGLRMVLGDGLVAVHDGVRPLVSKDVILQGFRLAHIYGGAIPVVLPSESLRKIEGEQNYAVDRNQFRLVQTPQTFNTILLKKSYEKPYEERFTDDASVFEADENRVVLFDGNRENIKMTWLSDFIFAETIISNPKSDDSKESICT
ncbi:MAG: 2-C-methyl-D-erythritol 4-phosphate cytidylyltransferase [Bacteroidales bacterium]|nr:2-C-methyl-D-erythritol 4-phosphate cytidylyltransferase [Bacteroidales bacterium]